MYFTPSLLEKEPVSADKVPFLNRCYLHTTDDRSDPSLVWGTEIDMSGLQAYLAGRNADGHSMLTTTPVLIRAVGLALQKHPGFNRRVLGERIYSFNEVNVLVPVQRRVGGPSLGLLRAVTEQSYESLFQLLWAEQQGAARLRRKADIPERIVRILPNWLSHLLVRNLLWTANHVHKPMDSFDQALRGAPVLVNYFGFPDAPPLLSYKASRFGSHCTLLNVTLGPTTKRPTVDGERIVIRPMAGLFVRADHRLVDACQLASFVGSLVEFLSAPENYDLPDPSRARKKVSGSFSLAH